MSSPNMLTLEQKRQRLALACQLDRLNLQLALKPTPLESLAISVMEKLAPIVPHLPGRLGTWTRSAMKATNLFRGVYEAMFS
jgi:hypothetical protein